jgi:hypothetical protein
MRSEILLKPQVELVVKQQMLMQPNWDVKFERLAKEITKF